MLDPRRVAGRRGGREAGIVAARSHGAAEEARRRRGFSLIELLAVLALLVLVLSVSMPWAMWRLRQGTMEESRAQVAELARIARTEACRRRAFVRIVARESGDEGRTELAMQIMEKSGGTNGGRVARSGRRDDADGLGWAEPGTPDEFGQSRSSVVYRWVDTHDFVLLPEGIVLEQQGEGDEWAGEAGDELDVGVKDESGDELGGRVGAAGSGVVVVMYVTPNGQGVMGADVVLRDKRGEGGESARMRVSRFACTVAFDAVRDEADIGLEEFDAAGDAEGDGSGPLESGATTEGSSR